MLVKNIRLYQLALFCLIAGIILLAGRAQPVKVQADPDPVSVGLSEQLDDYITPYVRALGIPALSIAVASEGEIIYSRVFGQNVSAETRFFYGSVSKPITALAVMQLVEQGRLDLDQSVAAYIPDFTVSETITVRHLLNQVSGMTANDYRARLEPEADFADLAADMTGIVPRHPAGETFAYFNPNYSLLGYLIEQVSGQAYPDYINRNLIQPLEMSRTSLTGTVDVPGHLSWFGFSVRRAEPFKHYDLPAGYISGTAEDLVMYLEAVRLRDPVLGLSPVSLELMETADPYGMGWMQGDLAGRPVIWHDGSLPGYAADAVMLREDGFSFVLLMNKNHLLNRIIFYPDLTEGVAAILSGQTPPARLQGFWLFRSLVLLFLLTPVLWLRKIIRQSRTRTMQTGKKQTLAMAASLVIPGILLALFPALARFLIMPGITWELAFFLMPDIVLWLVTVLLFIIVNGSIFFILMSRRQKNE